MNIDYKKLSYAVDLMRDVYGKSGKSVTVTEIMSSAIKLELNALEIQKALMQVFGPELRK